MNDDMSVTPGGDNQSISTPFSMLFAQRKQISLDRASSDMTNATASGTTSNDGSEEFDWIDDDN